VLAAEARAAAVGSNFSMDQQGFAHAVTAESHRAHTPESALNDVVRAFRAARDERRTAVLNLPIDVQAMPAPAAALTALEGLVPPVAPEPPRPSDISVCELADLIEAAERPVIVAGRGGRGAGPELRALAEASGALLATSAVAKGLFAGDPFDLGISGGFSSPLTAQLIADADLIIGVGCALNMWTTRHGRLIGPAAKVVQIDVESSALGALRPISLGVLGTGDGGFLMGLAELETAVRLGLPLLVIVYNDDAYGAEVHHFGEHSSEQAAPDVGTVTFPPVDLAALAQGFGADGLTVRDPADLAGLREWLAISPERPLVVDARIASDGAHGGSQRRSAGTNVREA